MNAPGPESGGRGGERGGERGGAGRGAAPLPRWLDTVATPRSDDFAARVVRPPAGDGAALWHRTPRAGLEVRTFERLDGGGAPRFAGQLRSAPDAPPLELDVPGAELLVQRGGVAMGDSTHGAGTYLRLPAADDADAPTLRPGSLAYLSVGQMAPTDRERRVVDSADPDRWLDGPVPGVRVLPLHGHRTGNVMLVRWSERAEFRTRLDPTGEELLVLEGTLHDARGDYPAGTWIRNPVPAWQSWAGEPGTLVCYKSGHFGERA